MKPRTVMIQFEIETDLPVKLLREAKVHIRKPCKFGRFKAHDLIFLDPVNKPKVEVVQASKRKGKK